MQTAQLSRLLITGYINENTPLCVLKEISDAHGIKWDSFDIPNLHKELLIMIRETVVTTVPTMLNTPQLEDMKHWQYLARFVNKNAQWRQTDLMRAYQFLNEFMNNEDPLFKIQENFIAGSQTPTNILAINACILYKTCVYHRLNVTQCTTINQMAYAVRMLRTDVESLLRRTNVFIERNARRTDLINILMLSNYEIQDPDPPILSEIFNPSINPRSEITHEMLTILNTSLTNVSELQQKIVPLTQGGAIALAALIYAIDISNASSPIREFNILKRNGRDNYQPGDQWLNYWYQRNPSLFDLTCTFNPLFPNNYYDRNRLSAMVASEGYTINDTVSSSPYELMQLNYVTENFYLGEMPNMKSLNLSIDLDPISTVPYGQLLCYGQKESKFQPISMTELIDLFSANQNFTNPFQINSVFTNTSINKLKCIAQSPNGPIPTQRISPETISIRNNLLEVINQVESLIKSNDEPTRQFGFVYRNSTPDTKTAIIRAFTDLLHAGMYMRGWLGPGNEYSVIKTMVSSDREGEIAFNVTNSINSFEKSCRILGKIGTQLLSLPLVYYKDGQYQTSTRACDGYSIGDRINIVKEGDRSSNISSCIRLSSNWICASAHKYLISLGQPPPFDIFNLRYIS